MGRVLETAGGLQFKSKSFHFWVKEYSSIVFTVFRKWVEMEDRYFLVGIVTGNPSSCSGKTLPDVYNYVGNEEVFLMKLQLLH